MSIRIMSEVWQNGPNDKSEVIVLLALADYCNDEGECWPAVASIAQKARMTERGAQKIIARLAETGWVEIEAGGGRKNCNLYRIKNPEQRSPRTPFTPNTSAKTPNTVPKNPEPRSPEPSGNHQEPSGIDNAGANATENPPDSPKPKKARLPEDWTPSDDDVEYALSQKLTHDEIEEIANDFYAYWTDRTDAGGRKSERGWKQTWRNRVRDQAPKFLRNRRMAGGQAPGGYGQGSSIAGIVARRRAEGQV